MLSNITKYCNSSNIVYSKDVHATIFIMDKHNFLPYFQTLQENGWTLRECIHGKGSETPAQVQPDWFKGSYQEYSDTIKSYILNIKIHAGIVQQPDTCLVPFSQRLNNL